VKLVACQSCHAQFDVTDVAQDEFACRCGATVKNEPQRAVDAEVHRCSSCGAIVNTEANACEFCGSEVVRDLGRLSLLCPECYARNTDDSRFCAVCGVGFQPEPIPAEGEELPCPDCGVLMPVRRLGSVGVNECPRCNGLWVPGEHFDALVARAVEQQKEGGFPGHRSDPRAKGSNPFQQQVRYRKCPVCEAFMHRRNFRRSSGVIIDRCREHGTWLDADELEQIAGYILSGGRPAAAEAFRAEAAAAESSYRESRQDNLQLQLGRGMQPTPFSRRESQGRGSLLGLLADLLG